jgi:N-acetylgalactosamine kinase
MIRPFATVILAGGKGTRMGSSDRHKVCFEVLGVPVIIRAIETYNLCGAALNVIVVGMLAENVMATVGRRFPAGVAYAFQDRQLGTGDAARKGAEVLERLQFSGDILVVAGDKVIEPKIVGQLLMTHQRSGADVTLAVARRPEKSSAGILLKSKQGNIVGILEEQERQRLAALGMVNQLLQDKAELRREEGTAMLAQISSEKALRAITSELWENGAAEVLQRGTFQARFGEQERLGSVKVGSETVAARDILKRFDQMNLSTYVFRASVLYDALSRLKSSRASQEEYLTDVFEILANRPRPARVIGCLAEDTRDLMAFNNPQELLAIEETYRQRHGVTCAVPATSEKVLAPLTTWQAAMASPSPAVVRRFKSWYGDDIPWAQFKRALDAFAEAYGPKGNVLVIRSPGRINLMGRHIDHQGGTVNVMAVNREIVLVASPRSDDVVRLANAEGTRFTGQTFRVSDLIANLNWDDWQHLIDGPRIQRLLETARGDWANYVKAAILRLQDRFRDRQLRGLDIMVSGNIPMGAGLSSSSALVVATAEAVRSFNRLPVSARRLVSLCGEGEWFVGTRGGAADHAAIKLSHRGCVTRVGFFPFQILDSTPFFSGHELVACNSGIYAGKSSQARNTFNAKVTAYHIGRIWFKMLRPDLAPRIEHLRDIQREDLGIDLPEMTHLLSQLPERITRGQVQATFKQIGEADRLCLERLFMSHDAPGSGYAVRGVVLFGLSEMARARQCLQCLKDDDASRLGRLMNTSHDGDRVSRQVGRDTWRRTNHRLGLSLPGADADLAQVTGAYGCSLPELDRIADLARKIPGVEGAQLAGAGLGGCVMVLVSKAQTSALLDHLARHGVDAEVFRPIAGAASLSL